MSRRGFRKSMMTCRTETLVYLRGIAKTFEDKMPLGDLVDMLADYSQENKLEDAIFGRAGDEDGELIKGEPPNVLSDLRTQTEDREANEDEGAPEDEEPEEELPRPRRRSGSGGVSLG